jgi:hypothetical protein
MRTRPDPAAISASRIARADQLSRVTVKDRDDLFTQAPSLTYVAVMPRRNPAEEAAADIAEALETRKAGRHAVRIVMGAHGCMRPRCAEPRRGESLEDVARRHPVGGHGCSGTGCGRPGHAEALEKTRTALEALGLAPYAAARNPNYAYGRAAGGGR